MIVLGLCMIVKDEEKTIVKTLNSCKNLCETYIIHDTGSTDNTCNVIREWCAQHKKHFIIVHTAFVDFAYNRTYLLRSALDTKCTHLLLLDSNEEIKNGHMIKPTILSNMYQAYMIPLKLKLGNTNTTFWNIKLIQNIEGWEYRMPVHEYIYSDNMTVCRLEEGPYVYQDRDQDIEKSKKRYRRDLEILKRSDQSDGRVLFYLAQTYHSLGEHERAILYFKKRLEVEDGHTLELYESLYRLGILTDDIEYFKRASEMCPRRAEPYVRMGQVLAFRDKQYKEAYRLLEHACTLDYPYDVNFFVDDVIYTEERYKLLSLIKLRLK